MVKIPNSDEHLSPEFIEARTQLLHDYGALLSRWGEFELAIEVKIAQLTNLAPIDASIIIGGLNFGNKPSILYSLLNERGMDDVAAQVRSVIDHAKRNALVHGVSGGDRSTLEFAFFKREVGSNYKVKQLNFTAETFNEHLEQLLTLIREAEAALGITEQDIDAYGREARLLQPTP